MVLMRYLLDNSPREILWNSFKYGCEPLALRLRSQSSISFRGQAPKRLFSTMFGEPIVCSKQGLLMPLPSSAKSMTLS